MPEMTRRSLVQLAAQGFAASVLAAPLTSLAQAGELPRPPDTDPASLASDERFWSRVARFYPRTEGIVNLEHGYWGKMALPVLAHYQRSTAMVNAQNAYYARTDYPADLLRSEARVAQALGVAADEIVLTRNATEAVHHLIRQYTAYQSGVAVLYSDVDYPSFQQTMVWLKQAHGVRPIRVELPARASADEILARYGRAFQEHPDIGLMLLTHASNQNGLVLPVAAIADLARRQGIDVSPPRVWRASKCSAEPASRTAAGRAPSASRVAPRQRTTRRCRNALPGSSGCSPWPVMAWRPGAASG